MNNQPVVMITGALAGIGRATAIAYAREGARIVVSGRSQERGTALVSELEALGAEAVFIRADVSSESDVAALVQGTVKQFGRLDIAINNAGTEGAKGPLTDLSVEDYRHTFDSNVLGTLLCLKHELKVMLAQGKGSIVNLSSTMGSRGAPNVSLYVASKHAVEGLTKSAALEGAAKGVRVNAVAPGPTETEMLGRFAGSDENKKKVVAAVPMQRAGTPMEIADAILYIASDRASFITGQIVSVNGGKTAS